MTGAELSYRKITENIAGKLDLLEAYLFYGFKFRLLYNGFPHQAGEANKILWY